MEPTGKLKFNCDSCGQCCRNLPAPLPKVCPMLDQATEKCTVYETRPNICNVQWMWENVHSKTTDKAVHEASTEAKCIELKLIAKSKE